MSPTHSFQHAILSLITASALAACGTVEGEPPDGDIDHRADSGTGDPDDHEAPSIVGITPEPGSTVTEDFTLVITFSEPMDADSVESAITLPNRAEPVFTWNPEGDQLTVQPWAHYPANADPSRRALDIAVEAEAADRSGNPMVDRQALAYQLKYGRLEAVFPYTYTLSGNCYAGYVGSGYSFLLAGENVNDPAHANRGFLTLPFSLPDDVVIDRAVLNTEIEYLEGNPFGFGDLTIDDVEFSAVNGDAFAAAGSQIGVLVAADPAPAVGDAVSLDVTAAFADDYQHRVERFHRTQFRFRFPHDDPSDPAYDDTHGDQVDDQVRFLRPQTKLTVTYLVE